MAAHKETKVADVFELEKKVAALETEVAFLKAHAVKADRILSAVESMAQVYGTYKGNDNRYVPAVITNAFPTAGTVDIVLFDNLYSGGKFELTGIYLGTDRNEMMPYLQPEPVEETEDVQLLAATP